MIKIRSVILVVQTVIFKSRHPPKNCTCCNVIVLGQVVFCQTFDIGPYPLCGWDFRKKFRKNFGKTPAFRVFPWTPLKSTVGIPQAHIIQGIWRLQGTSNSLPPSAAAIFFCGSGEGLTEPVMEFPAVLGVFQRHVGPVQCLRCGRYLENIQTPMAISSGKDPLGWFSMCWLSWGGFCFFSKSSLFKKSRLETLGWGHPIREKRPSGQVCTRTVGEPLAGGQEPWENRGRTVGGSKEPWENRGGCTENRGRTVGAARRTVGEPWELRREPWENRGDLGPKKQWLVVAQRENHGDWPKNRGRTVGIDPRTVGEPWGLTKEPWENHGGKIENRGDPQNPKQRSSKKQFWLFLAHPWPRGLFGHFWWREPWENRGGQIENRGDPKAPPLQAARPESHFTCSSPRCAPGVVPSAFLVNYFWACLGAWGGERGRPWYGTFCKIQRSLQGRHVWEMLNFLGVPSVLKAQWRLKSQCFTTVNLFTIHSDLLIAL